MYVDRQNIHYNTKSLLTCIYLIVSEAVWQGPEGSFTEYARFVALIWTLKCLI